MLQIEKNVMWLHKYCQIVPNECPHFNCDNLQTHRRAVETADRLKWVYLSKYAGKTLFFAV